VQVPATEKWELVQMLPTGRRLTLEQARELAQGAKFRGLQFDDVLTGLTFHDAWCEASLRAPGANRRVTIRFDDAFRECVLFTPQHREAICIEPYTCVPGLFELTHKGIDAGLRVLDSGASFTARVEIQAS
jgi:aldose 1-epimerase